MAKPPHVTLIDGSGFIFRAYHRLPPLTDPEGTPVGAVFASSDSMPMHHGVVPPALIRSVVEKLWPMGDDVTFVPGHGPISSFGEERRTNPFVSDAAMRQAPIQREPSGPA